MRIIIFLFLFFVTAYSCQKSQKESKQKFTNGQFAQGLHKQVGISVDMQYLLYLPEDYNNASDKEWPVLLFLHGSGERGNDLELVKKWGPPKLLDTMSLPFIVVSPQCPAKDDWQPHILKELLDEIVQNYKADKNRIYLTGLSMGGYCVYEMAIKYPTQFAALAPMSARGRTFRASKIAHIPVWAFHGAKDKAVPLKMAQDMINAINKAGGNAQLTIFPEAGHVCWDTVYRDKKFYDWLLEQKLDSN